MTAVQAATAGAKAFARRRDRFADWREHLADAWLGVYRDADPRPYGGFLGAIDGHRTETGFRRTRRLVPLTNLPGGWGAYLGAGGDDFGTGAYWLFDPPQAAEPAPTLLARWCDARPARAGWPWRARVWAYLLAVEGLTQAEVAALWGLAPTAVSDWLRRTVPEWPDRAERAGLTGRA